MRLSPLVLTQARGSVEEIGFASTGVLTQALLRQLATFLVTETETRLLSRGKLDHGQDVHPVSRGSCEQRLLQRPYALRKVMLVRRIFA